MYLCIIYFQNLRSNFSTIGYKWQVFSTIPLSFILSLKVLKDIKADLYFEWKVVVAICLTIFLLHNLHYILTPTFSSPSYFPRVETFPMGVETRKTTSRRYLLYKIDHITEKAKGKILLNQCNHYFIFINICYYIVSFAL